jgi:hypothetical protein
MEGFSHTGFVYLLHTTCLKDWVKIGYSNNVKRRMSELNTAVPIPFKALGIWAVEDHKAAELIIHASLNQYRSPYRTEHFALRTDIEHLSYTCEDGFLVEETISYREELRDFIEYTLFKNGFQYKFANGYFDN